jgi:ABC-type transporter Mla MlaB component
VFALVAHYCLRCATLTASRAHIQDEMNTAPVTAADVFSRLFKLVGDVRHDVTELHKLESSSTKLLKEVRDNCKQVKNDKDVVSKSRDSHA